MTIIRQLTGLTVPIDGNDIDTDRIIPARFLKEITFDHMGNYLFADARFDEQGNRRDHPLNEPHYANATIMIVDRNFGCGSSREHAPQSIKRYGIRALIGESFAEIFAGNCSSVGVPVVTASDSTIQDIKALIKTNPELPLTIDLESRTATIGTHSFSITMPESRRHAFLNGTWDSAAVLVNNLPAVFETATRLPYVHNFAKTPS